MRRAHTCAWHLKSREKVTDTIREFTPEQVTVGNVVARREEVLKLESFRPGGWSRGQSAAVGAAIGGGAGALIGIAVPHHRTDVVYAAR